MANRLVFALLLFLGLNCQAQPFNNVVLFNGLDDFIEIQNNFNTSFSSEITIEAWIKPCAINGHRMIVTKFYCVGNNNQFYFTILDGKLRWAWDNTGCNDGANFYETLPIIQANVWQHVAVRHTTTGVTLFLNGNPVPGSLVQGNYSGMLSSSEEIRIGVYRTITGAWFGQYTGLMDEVRIWDHPLTDNEIASRFNMALTGNEPGLAGYYDMDITGAGAGTVVPNVSANAMPAPNSTDGVAVGNVNSPLFFNQSNGQGNFIGNDTTLCIGESLTLNAAVITGTYLWQDGSTDSTLTATQTGLYHVTVTNSCEVYTDSIQVNFVPVPPVDLGNDTVLCSDETLLLTAPNINGITEILWQDASTNNSFLVDQPGLYSLSVSVGGCTGYDEVQVGYSNLTLDLGPSDTVLCYPDAINYNIGQPGATYLWQDGHTGGSYTINSEGLYIATISDNTCEATDSIDVRINRLTPNFSYTTNTECGESPVYFEDMSSSNFGTIVSLKWFVENEKKLEGYQPTTYFSVSGTKSVKLEVRSNYQCVHDTTISIDVEVRPIPVAEFSVNPFKPKRDEEIRFNNLSTDVEAYEWDFGDGNVSNEHSPIHTYSDPNTYRIKLSAIDFFCSDSTVRYVTINAPLRFYVPNAFTPDGNSLNQSFTPSFHSGYDPYRYKLTIFDRWGEVIFVSHNSDIGWDGFYGSNKAQPGAYVWQVEYVDIETNENITNLGSVTLLY